MSMSYRQVQLEKIAIAALMCIVTPAISSGADHKSRQPKIVGAGSARAAKAADPSYQLVRLEVPGSIGGIAVDINNGGTVVGVYFDTVGGQHTYVWDRAEYEKIIFPGASITSVVSITDSGRTLFGNWGTSTVQHAGTYDLRTGVWTPLPDYPGKPINIGWKMNNAGVAVGQACEGTFEMPVSCVAWIWTSGGYDVLKIATTSDPIPQSINDRGQIVGLYLETPPFGYRAFLYDRGSATVLLPTTDGVAYDINNQGEVLMLIEVDPTQFFVPAVYEKGSVSLLPLYPSSIQTLWLGNNERGDLAGEALADFFSPPLPVVALRK
jgi:hypothetical protein